VTDTTDPILDRLLADYCSPERRNDPKVQADIRGSFAYKAAVLDAELREAGPQGALIADRFAHRFRAIQENALRRVMPGLLPVAEDDQ